MGCQLTWVGLLVCAAAPSRSYFARQDLLGALQQQLRSGAATASSADSPAAGSAPDSPTTVTTLDSPSAPRPDSRAGLLQGAGAAQRPLRRRTTMAQRGSSAWETSASLLRRQQLLALAALLQDDGQKEALLARGEAALVALLADACSSSLAVRGGALECLASLTTHDGARQRLRPLRLLPLLLDGTACTNTQVQQPAAACLANLAADPGALLAELGTAPGLAPVVALAMSVDSEVQRHAAAALWHLSVSAGMRRELVFAAACGLPGASLRASSLRMLTA